MSSAPYSAGPFTPWKAVAKANVTQELNEISDCLKCFRGQLQGCVTCRSIYLLTGPSRSNHKPSGSLSQASNRSC